MDYSQLIQPRLDRRVLHLDLDSFFVAVERRRNPDLVGVPVLVGGQSPRSVVSSCSYETRAYGVHSGMPMGQARRLCPQAVVAWGGGYSEASQEVQALIAETVPAYQAASIDEFYCDLSGLDRFHDAWRMFQELRARIQQETQLPISGCLATARVVAKVGTTFAKPNGEHRVPPGQEAAFFAPLPVDRLPGVGPKAVESLNRMGLRTLGDVQQQDPELLLQRLGMHALGLWRRAHGVDRREDGQARERKQLSTEHTFSQDLYNPEELDSWLVSLVEKAAWRLRKKGWTAAQVGLKLRSPDFVTRSRQTKLEAPTNREADALPVFRRLFAELHRAGTGVRLLGVEFGQLQQEGAPLQLFQPDIGRQQAVTRQVDALRDRYGLEVVRSAKGLHTSAAQKRASRYNQQPPEGE